MIERGFLTHLNHFLPPTDGRMGRKDVEMHHGRWATAIACFYDVHFYLKIYKTIDSPHFPSPSFPRREHPSRRCQSSPLPAGRQHSALPSFPTFFFPLPFLSLKVSQTPLYRALSLAIYFTLWAAYPKYRRLRALSSTRLLVCSWLGSSLRSRCMAWLSSVSVLEIVPKILVVLPPELTDNWTRGDRNLYLFLFLPSWRYLLKVYRKLLAGLMLSDRNWYQLFLT